jgi:hypothetical protein
MASKFCSEPVSKQWFSQVDQFATRMLLQLLKQLE